MDIGLHLSGKAIVDFPSICEAVGQMRKEMVAGMMMTVACWMLSVASRLLLWKFLEN